MNVLQAQISERSKKDAGANFARSRHGEMYAYVLVVKQKRTSSVLNFATRLHAAKNRILLNKTDARRVEFHDRENFGEKEIN